MAAPSGPARRAAAGLVAAALLWLAAAVTAGGQEPAPPRLAEDAFTNIQVLKGMSVNEFLGTMSFFSAATGLNCTDCHTEESGGDWARYADDNELKGTTRRMVLMVNAINRTNFGGRQLVTCNTCHRGSSQPNVMPSLIRLYGEPPPDEPGEPFEAAGQADAGELFDRYLDAIGGTARLSAITSLVGSGTYTGFDDAEPSPMDFFAQAPNRRTTVVHTPFGDSTTTVTGTAAWIAAPVEEKPLALLSITGEELAGITVEASLLFPAGIRQAASDWRVGLPIIIDDREARPVQGTAPGGAVVTLCFDDETGLLTRFVRIAESPVGRLITQVDYDDYREVAGVRLPHRWTVTWLGGRSTFELADLRANAAVNPARFAAPVPAARP